MRSRGEELPNSQSGFNRSLRDSDLVITDESWCQSGLHLNQELRLARLTGEPASIALYRPSHCAGGLFLLFFETSDHGT